MKKFKRYEAKPVSFDVAECNDYKLQHERVNFIQQELGRLAVQRASIDKRWNNLLAEKTQIQIEWGRNEK